jgi:hypothetical protein
VRVALQRRGEAASSEREADVPAAKDALDAPAHRALEPLVAALETHDDLGDREHVLEVDENGGHALPSGRFEDAAQQRGLAVATRPDEAEGVTALGEREQLVGLGVAVDHLLGRKRPREAKRVQVAGCRHRDRMLRALVDEK